MTDSANDQSSLHALVWKRSSHSANGPHPQCVEAAAISGHIGLRDSKGDQLAVLTVPAGEWRSLLARFRQ